MAARKKVDGRTKKGRALKARRAAAKKDDPKVGKLVKTKKPGVVKTKGRVKVRIVKQTVGKQRTARLKVGPKGKLTPVVKAPRKGSIVVTESGLIGRFESVDANAIATVVILDGAVRASVPVALSKLLTATEGEKRIHAYMSNVAQSVAEAARQGGADNTLALQARLAAFRPELEALFASEQSDEQFLAASKAFVVRIVGAEREAAGLKTPYTFDDVRAQAAKKAKELPEDVVNTAVTLAGLSRETLDKFLTGTAEEADAVLLGFRSKLPSLAEMQNNLVAVMPEADEQTKADLALVRDVISRSIKSGPAFNVVEKAEDAAGLDEVMALSP